MILDFKAPANLSQLGIAAVADTHYGSQTCNEAGLKRWVNMIGDEGWHWISVGDLTENAIPGSAGDPMEQRYSPEKQIDGIVKILRPIASMCIGMVSGNHGRRSKKVAGIDVDKRIASDLRVPYFGATMAGRIRMGRKSHETHWKVMVHHLSGGGTTAPGKMRSLKKMAEVYPVMDLYIGGHGHADIHTSDTVYDTPVTRGEMRTRRIVRRFSMVGSTLEYQKSYAEEKGYPPASMCQVVHFLGKKAQVRDDDKLPDSYIKRYERKRHRHFRAQIQEFK